MAAAICCLPTVVLAAATNVTWDGGNGVFSASNWNGGQAATAVFNGNIQLGSGQYNLTIGNGDVSYVAGPGPNSVGAAPINRRAINPRSTITLLPSEVITEGSLTIKGGAQLHLTTDSTGDQDGEWTSFDVDLTLDNGTLKRDFEAGGNAEAGGILMFGSWNSVHGQQIDVNIINGGKIENDGQVWFGADEDHAKDLKVYMNIDNGTVTLTGGAFATSNNTNLVSADLAIFYGHDFGVDPNQGLVADGTPKNEDYRINFRGPGSLTVNESGIKVYRQDSSAVWTVAQSTYQDLWSQGILRASGVTGGFVDPASGIIVPTGRTFSNYFNVSGTSGAANYTVTPKALTVVTWDGGTGEWNDDLKWNGGQAATAVLGSNKGTAGGHAIVIDGSKPGGADVSYDPNPGTGTGSDFEIKVDNGLSSLTIKNGGKLRMNSASDDDGKWTRWGGDLNIDGAGSLFKRSKDGINSLSGGAFLLGGFGQQYGQEIDINITNGGRLENDGEVWFGNDNSAANLAITVNINNGSIDLTGGDNVDLGTGFVGVKPDLVFFKSYRDGAGNGGPEGIANEKYVINFTGPGSITVDHSGIYVITEASVFDFTAAAKTYQQLWADGILQANGQSGLTGANFGTYFSVTGTFGADNYTLTSLLTNALSGDYNSDGKVDAADYVVWRNDPAGHGGASGYNTWEANFGATAGAGAGLGAAAVPEPTSLVLLLLGLASLGFRRRTA
jgi:hypothetical protein